MIASSSASLVLPDGHPGAVVQHHLELVDVVDGLAAHQRMDAARVVADHPAERAAAVRRRIGRERQVVHFCRVTHAIEHDAGLHARDLRRGIERDDAVQVLREVHDDRDVAALAGEARARAARQDRRAGFAARCDRRRDVGFVERNDEPDGNLAVVRRVGGVERARAGVEPHFAAHGALQRALERFACGKNVARMRVRAWQGFNRHRDSESGLLPDGFDGLEARLADVGDGVGDRAGVPFEFAGLHLDAVRGRARALDRNGSVVRGDQQARSRQRVTPGRLAGLEDQPLDADQLVVERRFRLITRRASATRETRRPARRRRATESGP